MTDLRARITAAFSPTSEPPVRLLEASEPSMEKFFGGRRWADCRPRDLRAFGESLSFFTPEAFAYYLPAFLLAQLDDPKGSDNVGQSLCIHLASEDPDNVKHKLAALTAAQKQALQHFVQELGPLLVGTHTLEKLRHAL